MKVAGRWRYVYRAIDQHGQVIDVFVSTKRDSETRPSIKTTQQPRRGGSCLT